MLASLTKQLNKEGFTIVVITHDMRFVTEVADRAALMADGQIVLDGPTREVLYAINVLRKAGIKPPQVVQLALSLRERGLVFDALTVEEAAKELIKMLSTQGVSGSRRA